MFIYALLFIFDICASLCDGSSWCEPLVSCYENARMAAGLQDCNVEECCPGFGNDEARFKRYDLPDYGFFVCRGSTVFDYCNHLNLEERLIFVPSAFPSLSPTLPQPNHGNIFVLRTEDYGVQIRYSMDIPDEDAHLYWVIADRDMQYPTREQIRTDAELGLCRGDWKRHYDDDSSSSNWLECEMELNVVYRLWIVFDMDGSGQGEQLFWPIGFLFTPMENKQCILEWNLCATNCTKSYQIVQETQGLQYPPCSDLIPPLGYQICFYGDGNCQAADVSVYNFFAQPQGAYATFEFINADTVGVHGNAYWVH